MPQSAQALAYIRLLYDVEDQAQQLFAAQKDGDNARSLSAIRLALRQSLAVPRLEQFKAWLESQQASHGGGVLPKSPMGQAITYALNQWEALCVYCTDGDLDIDNNVSENDPAADRRGPRQLAVLRLRQRRGTPPRSSSASSPPASATTSIPSSTCATC